MATCKHCGEEIDFKPHPQNPARLAPFNKDGNIHFGTCGFKGSRNDDYHYMVAANGFMTTGFKLVGDGNSQTLSMTIETHDQTVRCQTMLKEHKVFLEIVGEIETHTFITSLIEYAKQKGIIK